MAQPTETHAVSPPEPIAVVGMGLRFPGQAHSSEAFWDMLKNGRTGFGPMPKHRYDLDGYYHPDGARAGSIFIKGSHFLSGEYEESVRVFDAPFFQMTSTEVDGSDPQQLHMLEVSYEALENAGIPMHSVAGSDTSVYVGCFTKDYEAKGGRDPYTGPFYAATGNGMSMLANRVSWFYDMRGPSMTVDTACSSSLYAVHLACQSLRTGESKMAIAGGTNIICDPCYMRDLTTMGFLSPDGKCHSFDHRANGYARGDGIAAVVLKTLSQALKDGDTIRGIIRNSGLGQDGRTPGITMPSPEAQADLIRSVYANAGLTMDQTAYFEAHGTGTPIGDPYELSALGATFGKTRGADNPLYVGSVKSNIGHLEGCAGLAGFIKAVLIVERGEIPPLADFEKANPRLKLDEWKVALPTEVVPWPTSGLRRASVNCFGYGGANSHVIIDDAFHYLTSQGLTGHHHTALSGTDSPDISDSDSGIGSAATTPGDQPYNLSGERPKLYILSSVDQAGLGRTAAALAEFLHQQDAKAEDEKQLGAITTGLHRDTLLSDLAYTLTSRRSFFDHRTFAVARSTADLAGQLATPLPKMRRGAKNNNLFFVFTGQGAQWATMGRTLLACETYRLSLERAQARLRSLGCSWSLIAELIADKDTSRIDQPELSQPLCTALQLALVDLLEEWGISPKAVCGHSSGEIAAAYCAGFLTHESAMQVAYCRGVYSADVNNRLNGRRGAMMAVALAETDVKPYLDAVPIDSVVVACVNSPNSVTLSGDEVEIEKLEKTLQDSSIFARKLRVKTAYHSPHMKVIAEDYLASMEGIDDISHPAKAAMFSSVTGTAVKSGDINASYWVKNMLNCVRFSDAMKALLTQPANPNGKSRRKVAVSYSAMIEIGPAEALKGPLLQILAAVDGRLTTSVPYTSMLARNQDAEQSTLAAAGKLWSHGISLDIQRVNFPSEPRRPPQSLACLPPYKWNRSKIFHHESAWGKINLRRSKPRTDLLGVGLENADAQEPRWHNYIRLSEQPWLADHRVQQNIVYPGAAMCTQAIEAVRTLCNEQKPLKAIELRNIAFKKGLLVPSGDAFVETAIHLRPERSATAEEVGYSFQIFSQSGEEPWIEMCTGSASLLYRADDYGESERQWQCEADTYKGIRRRACRQISAKTFYKLFDDKMNLQYGPLHRNVTECTAGTGEGLGVITIPDTKAIMPAQFEYPHLIHPATLDSVFHLQALGYLSSLTGDESLVPISIDSIYIASDVPVTPGVALKGYSKGLQSHSGDTVGDIVLSDDDWTEPKVVVRGFLSRDISASIATQTSSVDTRARKCTNLQFIPLHPEKNPELNANGDEEDSEDSDVAADVDQLIILSSSSASSEMSLVFAEIRVRLSGACKRITPMHPEQITFGDESNIKGKTIMCLLEAEEHYVSTWSEKQFSWFRDLASVAGCIFWVTRGADVTSEHGLDFSVTTGLLRTVRVEKPQLRLYQLDLDATAELASDSSINLIVEAFNATVMSTAKAIEQELIQIDNKLHVPRLVTDEHFHSELSSRSDSGAASEKEVASVPYAVRAEVAGNGQSIRFVQDDESLEELADNEVELAPAKVMLDATAFGGKGQLGRDAVGVITAIGASVSDFTIGERVVVCTLSSLRTRLRVKANLVQKQPQFLSSSVAVTVPTAITTAWLALHDLGRLQEGESVLLSVAPDATGGALIYLAQYVGARILASFETAFHRRWLIEQLGLEEDQVIRIDRGDKFKQALFRKNRGKGVDVVINSMAGDIAQQSVSCLSPFGRCVFLGSQQHLLTRDPFANGISIVNLDLDYFRTAAPERVANAFQQAWNLAKNGVFHSLPPKRTLDLSFFKDSTSLPDSVKAAGGVAVNIDPTSTIMVVPPPPPKLSLDSEAVYVLAGGLGGVGRSIAETMFAAGARKIIFISRSGAKAEEAKKLLSSLQARGCEAKAFACDVSSGAAVEAFVKGAVERGEKIRGVIQCAMALRDSVFDNMVFEQWVESTQPKIQGSWNLHKYLPEDMDFFIMLSSMAGIIGNPGQANYSAAGTYQDALSVHRRKNGLKATTIDLGIVSDVGYIAENPEQFERLRYLKPLFISERDLRILLSTAMLGRTMDGQEVPAQIVTGVGRELMQDGSIGSAMAADLKYSQLHGNTAAGVGDASEDEATQEALKEATTLQSAYEVVESSFASQIAKACSLEKEDVDLEKPMHAYGVDSLAAVEVRNMIFRKFKADVSVFDILSTLPLHKLAVKVVAKSALSKNSVQIAAQDESAE